MLKSGAVEQRRTRSDIVGVSSSQAARHWQGQRSEGQLHLAEKPRSEGGFVVRRQMKQVVGDLVTVLGELRTVVGDIRTLVSQIDVVTHKIDQSVSSDQSDKSAASSVNAKSAVKSTATTTTTSGYPSSYRGDDDDGGGEEESGRRRRDGAEAMHSSDSKSTANVCDLLCFGGQQARDKLAHRPSGFSNAPGVSYLADRQGERLSNHDRVYVAYRPRFSRHSIDRRPSAAKRATSPLRTAGERTNGKENLPSQKPGPPARSNAYITHIYENIKAFARKTSPVAPSTSSESQNKTIPNKPCKCLCSAPVSSVISPKMATSRWHQANKDMPHVLKPHNNNNNNMSPSSGHRTKAKVQHEYSGLYEREMEEKLELEFDESLDLLDTLADIQTVDNDFEPACDDSELLTPVRDPYPIDLIRKHADVVAWAQSAWPETRYPDARYPGNSVGCSEDDDDERETDSEWYDQAAVPRRTLNCQHFVNFSWRPVIEP